MIRTVKFELRKFSSTPAALRKEGSSNIASTETEIDLCRLYHHFYLDGYGKRPPNPDHTNFEYLRFLTEGSDFRFQDDGPGASVGKKREISTNLGQAFCRYFLYEFCGITYFAHMDRVLNKKTHPAFDQMEIQRAAKGDVPDYLCARTVNKPYIAEAKGRYRNISFVSAEFDSWREQFDRIEVKDRHGGRRKLKGFIVGTTFGTELRSDRKTKIYAEDPYTKGDTPIDDSGGGLGMGCVSIHYSELFAKLGLNLLSQSLEFGFSVPPDLSFNLPVWECMFPALKGMKFVGGFFADTPPNMSEVDGRSFAYRPNILELSEPSPIFFGLELGVFQRLRSVTLGEWNALADLPTIPDSDIRPSNIAWLRDGSVTGPLEYFRLLGINNF